MARRWTERLALALFVPAAVVFAATWPLTVINRHAPDLLDVAEPFQSALMFAFALVGLLLALRRPHNALGWLFLTAGLLEQVKSLAAQWAIYALETHPGAQVGPLALWLNVWLGVIFTAAPTFPLLLFPSGRLHGWASRIIAVVSGAGIAGLLLSLMSSTFVPPGFPDIYATPNPLAWRAEPIVDPGLMIILVGICGLLSAVVLLARFRESRGVTRQQYTWVVLSMALIVATYVADFLARASGSQLFVITGPAQSLAIALLPISMGVAILRHRLFDIDKVFSRVLVYGILSVSLVAAYALGVIFIQRLLDPLTRGSDLAVAATTLLVAALFRPLRGGVQRMVDRRFNRARYDAARVIDGFGGRLRDEVDLDAIGAELQSAIIQSMQPTHVSIWLRTP